MLTVFNITRRTKWLIFVLLIILSFLFTIYSYYNRYQNQSVMKVINENIIVVIDPGHGSIDSGTSYNDIKEKDINLEMAKQMNKIFENDTNITPILTRTEDKLYKDDRNKDIKYRAQFAKKNNADIFISLHVNNFSTSKPSGAQIFYKPNSKKSEKLAEIIKKELKELRKENDRPIFEGKYYVLQKVDLPAVLIESGFLSNPEDRKLLTNPEYQKKFVKSVKRGLINYLKMQNYDL